QRHRLPPDLHSFPTRRSSDLDTEADPTWDSLFTAPRHQEYMSNHAVITTAFMNTLAELLGDEHTFTLSAPGYAGFTWTFDRFSRSEEHTSELQSRFDLVCRLL